jgi:hypothetical protein
MHHHLLIIQNEEKETTPSSRRRCLVCLGAVTLISATGPPNGLAADAMNKAGVQKAVCRNCNGSGAVICKGLVALVHFVCSLLMLNDFICVFRRHVWWHREMEGPQSEEGERCL